MEQTETCGARSGVMLKKQRVCEATRETLLMYRALVTEQPDSCHRAPCERSIAIT
jgi:hypothetical protein